MADYTTPETVRGLLTRDRSAPEHTAAELDDATLAARITTAQNTVDARLAGRYSTPFDPVPPLVSDLTAAIAAYFADLTHRQSTDIPEQDPVYRRYQWALDLLTSIAAGDADVPGAETPGTDSGVYAVNPYEGRLFGLDDFRLGVGSAWDVR